MSRKVLSSILIMLALICSSANAAPKAKKAEAPKNETAGEALGRFYTGVATGKTKDLGSFVTEDSVYQMGLLFMQMWLNSTQAEFNRRGGLTGLEIVETTKDSKNSLLVKYVMKFGDGSDSISYINMQRQDGNWIIPIEKEGQAKTLSKSDMKALFFISNDKDKQHTRDNTLAPDVPIINTEEPAPPVE